MTGTQFAAALLTASIAAAGFAPGAGAQSDSGTPMLGLWELSNADRDKICMINFKLDAAGPGRALEFQKGCAEAFPETKDIVAWAIVKAASAVSNAAHSCVISTMRVSGQIPRMTPFMTPAK